VARKGVTDYLDTSSLSMSYDDFDDQSMELFADESDVKNSEVTTASGIVVTGLGLNNLAGSIGISHLIFTSDQAIKLSEPGPLFSTSSLTYQSQSTFFQRPVTLYTVPITEVTSKLFFGSFADANDEEKLLELGITHIISLIGPKNPIKGIKHKHKPMSDYGRTDLQRLIKYL